MKKQFLIHIIATLLCLNFGCSTSKAVNYGLEEEVKNTMNKIDSTYWKGIEEDGIVLVSKNGLFGLANSQGNILLPIDYDRIFPFKEGKAVVCKNNRYGILSEKGKEIIAPIYNSLDGFSSGLCFGLMNTEESESILLNKFGKNLAPEENSRISRINGRYVQLEDGHFILFNDKGEKIHSTNIFSFGDQREKFWGDLRFWWFTREPQLVNESYNYSTKYQQELGIPQGLPFYFNEGMAVIPKLNEGKVSYGYIDETGTQIIPFAFDEAKYFVSGKACAKKENRWGIIDKSGTWIVEPKFEDLESTNGDYFIFSKGNLKGVINSKGEVLVEAAFLKAEYLFDHVFAFLEDNEITRQNVISKNRSVLSSLGGQYWGAVNVNSGDTLLSFNHHEILGINSNLGIGFIYDFKKEPSKNLNKSDSFGSLAPAEDYKGDAICAVFTANEYKEEYNLETIQINQLIGSPGVEEIKKFDLPQKVNDYVLISGVYLNLKGEPVIDKALILELNRTINRMMITHETNDTVFGLKNWKEDQILAEKHQEIILVNTGVITKFHDKYGFYDFLGNLLISHEYTFMQELPTGLLLVSKDEFLPNSIVRGSTIINKRGVQILN